MQQGRPVDLAEHIFANLDDVVRADSQYRVVERSVVNRAHCHTVRDDGFATFGVLANVRRIQKLCMSQSAQSTLTRIRHKHALSKEGLVDSAPDHFIDVLPLECLIRGVCEGATPLRPEVFTGRDHELPLITFFVQKPDSQRTKQRRADGNEPDQRLPKKHGLPESLIVVGIGVRSLPLVAGVSVRPDVILVRTIFRSQPVGGPDRQCCFEASNDPDPTHVLEEGDSLSFEGKLIQILLRDEAAPAAFEAPNVLNRGGAESIVERGLLHGRSMVPP